MQTSSESRTFEIAASTGRYDVEIAAGLLRATVAEDGDRVFIVDARLADRIGASGGQPIVIEADEPAKSLDRMADLVVALRDRRATRATELVAVGGGVVQDIVAFVASIYMRGVRWSYVPTTLLSMTGSCIGGKSSINVGKYKSIVGTFHPPTRVLIDPELSRSLTDEQRAAGLCEAAKICFCRGLDEFDHYDALSPSPASDVDTLTQIVERSLRAKKWFIEIDEFDRAERLRLNFGHSFGHAIEADSSFAVSHGIAVGLGMLAALHLGEAMGRSYARLPQVARLRAHIARLLASVEGLPGALDGASIDGLMDAFRSDKKHEADRFAVILVEKDGAVRRTMLPRNDDTVAMIAGAFGKAIENQRRMTLVAA